MDMNMAMVTAFLKEFKKLATKGRGIYFVKRREHINALTGLGLTEKNRFDEIMSLSVADYCKGPEQDKDMPGEIWEFGRRVGGQEVYIKLKIADAGGEKMAKCISFHKASYPQTYPFKSTRERENK